MDKPERWRTESDSLGEVPVPAEALYGAQTQRAVLNFPVSGLRMPEGFVRAMLHIKSACALANREIGVLDEPIATAIATACETLAREDGLMQHFPVDVFQTGSGTSSNMNANEVIAHVATSALGVPVHPNDHVNLGQSSNDVVPSALHVALAVAARNDLLPALAHLQAALQTKAAEVGHHVKTGRTHLMDAMPVRLGQVIGGWTAQVQQAAQRIEATQAALCRLAQGGSAVGTGVNVHPDFGAHFYKALSVELGLAFEPAPDFFAAMGAQDTVVAHSGQLKALAVALMKIANDLRWMNSGPLAGLAEIALPELQPGSSIMPGKVNPVIPEAVAMVAAQVIGNDAAITIAGQSGNFELNVMLPLMARNALESSALLSSASRLLADRAIAGFVVNETQLERSLSRNPILVTALNPVIGYAAAAKIAKEAYRSGRPVLDVAEELTDLGRERLQALLDPARLTGAEA